MTGAITWAAPLDRHGPVGRPERGEPDPVGQATGVLLLPKGRIGQERRQHGSRSHPDKWAKATRPRARMSWVRVDPRSPANSSLKDRQNTVGD